MTTEQPKFNLPIRLAFRAEGDFVNVYHEDSSGDDGIILLATMRRALLDADPLLWEQWKAMMMQAYCDALNRAGGGTFSFTEMEIAPENCGGNA